MSDAISQNKATPNRVPLTPWAMSILQSNENAMKQMAIESQPVKQTVFTVPMSLTDFKNAVWNLETAFP